MTPYQISELHIYAREFYEKLKDAGGFYRTMEMNDDGRHQRTP